MASLQQLDNASQCLTQAKETNKRNKIMHFKLIIAFVEDRKTDDVMNAAREAGATGCTVINNARGEGIKESKTFLGLTLATQRDVVLMLVEQHLSRHILEHIGEVGEFDAKPGTGIAVVVDVEDAVGVVHQAEELGEIVEEIL
jgi:nitrogen regulatory protein PII